MQQEDVSRGTARLFLKEPETSLPAEPAPREPRLLEQVRSRIRLKHYSLRTERAYLYWIRRYIFATGKRHPRELNGVVVEGFLSRLATEEHVSPSTQAQALSVLLFLYKEVLGIDLPWMDHVVRAKQRRHVPSVLSQDEVARLLRHLSGRDWLQASLLYGTGMRLMECLRLRIKDIDFERNEICIREPKGSGPTDDAARKSARAAHAPASGTVLRRTCWRTATTSVPYRNCSATRTSLRRRSIPMY